MNTKHYLDKVDEFHVAMMYRQPTPESPCMDDETCQLRIRLIQEEWDELMDAISKDDACGQLDALCDLQYVISGAALALGFRHFHITAVSLAAKHAGDTFSFGVWIAQLATHLFKANIPGSYYALAALESDLHSIVKTLCFSGVFDEAFEIVHASNMSKVWQYDASARFPEYRFVENGNGGFIAYRNDMKIMKPTSFIAPHLQPLVERALA